MSDQLDTVIEKLIGDQTGRRSKIIRRGALTGGCIHRAERIELEDRRPFFLKTNSEAHQETFASEASGLAALAEVGVIRVPLVLGFGAVGGTAYLLMSFIETGRKGSNFNDKFGRSLARLHRQTSAAAQMPGQARFGFDQPTFLGATLQENDWCDNWVEFWSEHRLGFQLSLARENGLADREMLRCGESLLNSLEDLIAEPAESPCLLHGDLWGGNYLCDESGAAVLIDPAVYFGRREADLAMTLLFGGFEPDFYRGYEAEWPLAAGVKERLEVYKLYHLLNHLNLFGSTYYESCMTILRRFA